MFPKLKHPDRAAAFKTLTEKAGLVGTAPDYVASLNSADIDAAKQLDLVWDESAVVTRRTSGEILSVGRVFGGFSRT